MIRKWWVTFIAGLILVSIIIVGINKRWYVKGPAELWKAPDTAVIPHTAQGAMIRYGRDLIAYTAIYLGPEGKVAHISNGMNCQNCHLNAGTKPWGNNYAGSTATYPKFRERSGTIESLVKKVNDCLIRSLNGSPLDSNSREMKAIIAYMHWLGKNVKKGYKPPGSGLKELPYLARAADPARGKRVFEQRCQQCHGKEGAGKPDSIGYVYPPLWGENSYNTGAGIYRLSKFAGYVKTNMPWGDNRQLTDEEAWDVAAFVNSQPRPFKEFSADWPVINTKPVDLPFGPFSDTFPALQHKYGPFGPIVKQKNAKRI
jgi:thiosulfate dehydrogenase